MSAADFRILAMLRQSADSYQRNMRIEDLKPLLSIKDGGLPMRNSSSFEEWISDLEKDI